MEQFLEMGGYARFVWPSFALALAVIVWNVGSALRLLGAARAQALRLLAAQPPPGVGS
jgi:heme exporter protein CcmD